MSFLESMTEIIEKVSGNGSSPFPLRREELECWFAPEYVGQFIDLYYRLEDEDSRSVLLNLIYHSFDVFTKGKMPVYIFYSQDEWTDMEERAKNVNCFKNSYLLDIIETFILEGYNYKNEICVKQGQYVFDCGAYTGNTGLYFARLAGNDGHIYSFEAMPQTFRILENNVKNSRHENISIHNFALNDKTCSLYFDSQMSPGSRIQKDGIEVNGISIDDFVERNMIERLDFIKMDIEGAELSALLGARRTCERFRPDLAICVYHKPMDLIAIPQILLKINPCYRFYLKQNSCGFSETVLFARHGASPKNIVVDDREKRLVLQICQSFLNLGKKNAAILRRNLLEMYDVKLRDGIKIPYPSCYDEVFSSLYLFYPISDDKSLHYEFLIYNNRVNICLHFEGRYANHADIAREIANASEAQSDLHVDQSYGALGCRFTLDDIYAYDHIVALMKYLMRLSLPILRKYKLLPDVCLEDSFTAGNIKHQPAMEYPQ